ncbi:MAG: hypothetical protein ACRDSL_23300 [Pseudonocardiaceae bacterium]
MPADLVGVEVELADYDLDNSFFTPAFAAPVEALGIGEQFEGMFEELPSGLKRAGGVGKLGLDLTAFSGDTTA